MKGAIRKIDRALKALYHLDGQYRAEDFLVTSPESPLGGALYVKTGEPDSLSVGIYLSPALGPHLSRFGKWGAAEWSTARLGAFTTVSEEISHFHYLLHHAVGGRPVSKLEMEVQGEIDKFLLAFFAGASGFEALVEKIFFHFHLSAGLSEEDRARYLDANALAKRFILKYGPDLSDQRRRERLFRLLRRFYRLNASEKISLIAG